MPAPQSLASPTEQGQEVPGPTQEHTAPAAVCPDSLGQPILPVESCGRGHRSTTQEGYNMVSVIMLVVIGLCIGWIVWMRRGRARAYTAPAMPGGMPRETLVQVPIEKG